MDFIYGIAIPPGALANRPGAWQINRTAAEQLPNIETIMSPEPHTELDPENDPEEEHRSYGAEADSEGPLIPQNFETAMEPRFTSPMQQPSSRASYPFVTLSPTTSLIYTNILHSQIGRVSSVPLGTASAKRALKKVSAQDVACPC